MADNITSISKDLSPLDATGRELANAFGPIAVDDAVCGIVIRALVDDPFLRGTEGYVPRTSAGS